MFEPPPFKLRLSSHYLFEEETYITEGLKGVKHLKQAEFDEYYEVGEVIGQGSFSQVHIAKCKTTGQVLACKVVNKHLIWDATRLREEIRILSNIKHHNIVQVHDIFETEDTVFLLLELANGGELFHKIVEKNRFSEQEAKQILQPLIEATAFLHSQNVVHRDIKPENILLTSVNDTVNVLITDFGLAKVLDTSNGVIYDNETDTDESSSETLGDSTDVSPGTSRKRQRRPRAYTSCGSDYYMAPEILSSHGYGPQVDMWSIGVVMFIMLCGKLPFSQEGKQLYTDIKRGKYDLNDPSWSDVSDDAKDLLKKLLTVDAEKRITAADAKTHPWFS